MPPGKEEKLLIQAFRKPGVEPIMMNDRKLIMVFHTSSEVDILVDLFSITTNYKTCLCCG